MNNIKSIEIISNSSYAKLKITHEKGQLSMPVPFKKENSEKISIIINHSLTHGYSRYEHFKKEKLLIFQNILLNAYVFSHDKLEMAVNNSESIDTLKILKERTLLIRAYLRDVTTFIDCYPEKLEEFKEDQI
ncbi:hypothetical protein H9W90_10320 [Polaribacter pectinis]|uniref:Uncharacterized protein n=1 Tax=Polaribacter pectinis TaxID=2738844 RepID=A0A7G9L7J2_9FLAO|nr:hypothetical protein [Polaribacter pectinis]QNM84591.1 hypothetical protein H9W90_10320 [Polaribacter pectinis]